MCKIAYITFVPLSINVAQEIQVNQMSKAINKFSEKDFVRIGFKNNKPNHFDYIVEEIDCSFRLNILRKLEFTIRSQKYINRNDTIFTRNKIIAFLYVILGNKVFLEIHEEIKNFIPKILLRIILKKKNLQVVVISEGLKSYLKSMGDFKNEIVVSHDAVNQKFLINKLNLKSKRKVKLIVYTGSLHKGKDLDQISFFKNSSLNFKLLIIGGSEDESNELKKRYNDDRIKFIKRVSHKEALRFQLKADLLFYPLSYENKLYKYTSPLKLFEYMSTGIPIIASTIGSIGEVVDENSVFSFLPSFKQDQFDKLLNIALNNEEVRLKKAHKSIQLVLNNTWENRVKYLKL